MIKSCLIRVVPLAVVGAAMLSGSHANAQKLSELLPTLLQTHDLVKAAKSDVDAASNRRREALGAWFPTATVTGHSGYENFNKPHNTLNTELYNRVIDLTVTQLLWDFGGANSNIRAAELNRDIAVENLTAAEQDLILRAITAYLNLKRAADVLEFAKQSEDNIKKQTELEDALVRRGAGLSSDVLQAKQQLAGAAARRVQADGLLQVSRNAYRAVFRANAPASGSLSTPQVPIANLPTSLEEAIEIAIRENPRLSAANNTSRVSREAIGVARGALSPRIEAVGTARHEDNDAGTAGRQQEFAAKVQLTFPFNLGVTAVNTLNAAENDAISTHLRASEQRHLIEEQVRNAWDNLTTSRNTAEFLRNQANITAEFLELARKERQLGNRSLIDVLAGETALINANSDARSAETDIQIWAFTLLNAMGRLTLDTIAD